MQRRDFLWLFGGGCVTFAVGCHDTTKPGPTPGGDPDDVDARVDPTPTPDAASTGPDACTPATVTMHDTNAQALYLDGSYGPLTGDIKVAYVLAGTTITLDFWHGHNGVNHKYTLEPSHFAQLKAGQKITLGTTTVEDHSHTLFIDPTDEDYRVPGAPDVQVPLDHC